MYRFVVYILRCNDGSYYVGHTDQIEIRISQHQLGVMPCYTASRLPVELVFMESFITRIAALTCERKIKNWSRAKKEALIQKNWNKLTELSKKKF